MTETADPRIALMQKWSQENPALMAQAGLASSADVPGQHHMLDENAHDQRAALIQLAGVTAHSARGSIGVHNAHNTSNHTGHQHTGKHSKGKANTYLPTAGVDFVFSSHGNVHNQTKHHKEKPFIGVSSEKLAVVYKAAVEYHTKEVISVYNSMDLIASKLPPIIRQQFNSVAIPLKQYRVGNQNPAYSYDKVFQSIEAAHAALLASYPKMKYTVHKPKNEPGSRQDVVTALLSRLISLTIEAIKVCAPTREERTQFGLYDITAQRRQISGSRKNEEEVHNAWARAKINEEKKSTIPHAQPHVPPRLPRHKGVFSEFTEDKSFSMAHPYTP